MSGFVFRGQEGEEKCIGGKQRVLRKSFVE